MPKLSVKERRQIFNNLHEGDDIWICEVCGEQDDIESLIVYEIDRITRNVKESREVCMCISCADRVPHGKVISS
jgi:hypothetical protein